MVKNAVKSWKTSVVGILTAASAWIQCAVAVLDADPATNPEYGIAVSLSIVAIGLLTAKDSNK